MTYQALAEDSVVHITDDRHSTLCGKLATAVNDTGEPILDKPGCAICEGLADVEPVKVVD